MASLPVGYEWTETDWASDGVDAAIWAHPRNSYSRSKVDTERLINDAADEGDGRWDAVTMNPAMICGPILFKAQVGQWIEQIGRLAGGMQPSWPSKQDMFYNIIDVRDLVKAHRLAAESTVDHAATHGGARYLMHGSGGRSALRLGTEVVRIIRNHFPAFEVGAPATVTDSGDPVTPDSRVVNDCRKAKTVLGATIRPVEETIRDVVESVDRARGHRAAIGCLRLIVPVAAASLVSRRGREGTVRLGGAPRNAYTCRFSPGART